MRKILVALIGLMFIAESAFAAVTITTSAKTFEKAGGAASVVVQGDGAWTAVSDVPWIVIKQGASGSGAGSCVYIVNANATADTRIGHLTIGGNIYTITQHGYTATISPSSATFDRKGGSGTISVTVDAGISWSAVANDSWIEVSPASGMSVGTVSYTVAPYDAGVVSRVGSVTIGGKTFTITQTGADVSVSPERVEKESGADIIAVTINALSTTRWTVTPNDSWISVIDKQTGYGDYVLTLAINANPSFARRVGTVSIGSETFTISQAGTASAYLSIDPSTATAAATGAYGNIAVYATPDASWTAISTVPWLTISEGANGAGNGNIKYVTSANPTLEERTGEVVITPPHKVIEPDLYRGLLFWIKDQSNVEGNDTRSTYKSTATVYNGSFYNYLRGADIPGLKDEEYSYSFSFKVSELGRVNRLAKIGDARNFYLDEDNVFCAALMRGTGELGEFYKTKLVVDKIDQWYTVLFCQESTDSGMMKIYAGLTGEPLQCVATYKDSVKKSLSGTLSPISPDKFMLGYATYPSNGNLTGGSISNIRFWTRALSETECQLVDVNQDAEMSVDDAPLGAPASAKWVYYPLDGNAYATTSERMSPNLKGCTATGWVPTEDRFEGKDKAYTSTGNGVVKISNVESLFSTQEKDATYSVWMKVDSLLTSNVNVFGRYSLYSSSKDYGSYGGFCLALTKDGLLSLRGSGLTTTTFNSKVSTGDWHLISVVGKSGSSIQVYLDGVEIGNIASGLTLGYYRYYYSSTNYSNAFTLGGWNGAVDDLQIYRSALTSAQIRELYNQQRVQKVVHTVTQGVQKAQLNKAKVTAPAHGATDSVNLTLAQSVQWSAQSNNYWISILSDETGAGSAVVSFQIAANPAVTSRKGSITVAGIRVDVIQEGLYADVSCEDTSFTVDSNFGTVWVETEGGGLWTATTDVDWIHLLDESGIGSAPVMFVIDDYITTTAQRTGTITVAGKKVVITQQGYELSIDPMIADIGSNAGAGQFGVAAPIDAVWEAIADCDWITIIGSRTGIGDGTIQYTVKDNLTGETRTGRIVVGGKIYTITQRTTLPVSTQVVGKGKIVGAGNYNQGTKVTLKATPDAGYVFSHWSGDAVGNDDSVEITVDIEKNVTATFIPEAAAQVLAEKKAAQGGFYTRDQIHALELGNLVLDVDASGTARIGVQLMETSDLSDPNSWKAVDMSAGSLDVGSDGSVGMNVKATGNAKFYKVVASENK